MLRRFLGILASVLLFLIGLPSLSGDIARAATMLVGAAWWNYLFMGSGIALFSYTLATWGEKNPFSKVADFFRMPDWYVAAKNKSSFKLYEAACLFIGQKPAWPLPTDRAEEEYLGLLNSVNRRKGSDLEKWSGNIHEFEIDRRTARQCFKGYHFRGDTIPWFLKEKFDKATPPGRSASDDRRMITPRDPDK